MVITKREDVTKQGVRKILIFSAFMLGAYFKWTLIRGWALIRINTLLYYSSVFILGRTNFFTSIYLLLYRVVELA